MSIFFFKLKFGLLFLKFVSWNVFKIRRSIRRKWQFVCRIGQKKPAHDNIKNWKKL